MELPSKSRVSHATRAHLAVQWNAMLFYADAAVEVRLNIFPVEWNLLDAYEVDLLLFFLARR